MKDKEIIQKLQLLQSVQPDSSTLREVRKRVLPYYNEERSVHSKWYQFQLFVPVFIAACMIVVVLITSSDILLLSTRIALASNQYQKAELAFTYTDTHYPSTDIQFTSAHEELFAQSLKLTNTQMSQLKLMGEKGKYSAQQCRQLYAAYHDYLENIEKTSMFKSYKDTQEGRALAAEIKQYDVQAEEKLHKYNK